MRLPFLNIAFLTGLILAQVLCSAAEPIKGLIGVGTWGTKAEFRDVKVTHGGETLYACDFSNGLDGWTTRRGDWKVVDGTLRQLSDVEDARILVGDRSWSDYTLTLKARKLAGAEGFLILFGMPSADSEVKSWWNLGGWQNSQHGLESPGLSAERTPGNIETNRWYDIKVELQGGAVKTYLDNKLVFPASKPSDENAQRDFPKALVPDLLADPSIVEYDGVFYLFGTTDGMGQGLATSGPPVVWTSKDFLHWSFEGTLFADNFAAKYWAPSTTVHKDGRYHLFPTLDNHITATVADKPEGPYKTLDGKDLSKTSGWKNFGIEVGHPIDADIFRDDDGSYYMTWSKHFMGKLNDDFSSFDGKPTSIRVKRGGYSEGPQVFKRNGIYYYLYTLEGHENYKYAYMMSRESVHGPWEGPEQDIIARTNHETGVYGPGHGYFFSSSDSDQWYFVHLEYGRGSTMRQPIAQKMFFNPDGTIQPIEISADGVGALRTDPRYTSPNLALGCSATASSSQTEQRIIPRGDRRLNRIENFQPANALDASNGSRWMATEDDDKPTFTLDLGEARDISRTELCFVKPTLGHSYRLEASLDGETWQPYGGHDDVQVRSPHVDERAAQVRYLKLTILEGTPGLWDFRVY